MPFPPPPGDLQSGGAADAGPVEQFVRDVLPTVPGGPRQVTEFEEHPVLVRRAAVERGLSVTTLGGIIFFHDGQLAVGGVHEKRMTTLVGKHAIAVCDSKDLTKQVLRAAGLPTPDGVTLSAEQFDDALTRVMAAGPAVLKPSYGMRGEGVTVGIATEDDLRSAWTTAERAAKRQPAQFVLEEQIAGIDIRAFVVGRRLVAAATRVPAHVVGDGQLSIGDLIELKQQRRDENAYVAAWPLVVNSALLARAGRTLGDVPGAHEVVVLNDLANLHAGGENIDVTELLHPDLRSLAVDAVRAVPGLCIAGVDLMAPDLGSAGGAVILEINAGANIGLHHYPAHGRPRDVAGAIVDEMIATAGARSRAPARQPRRVGMTRRVAGAARRRLSGHSR